jgi:beta-galactosidase
MGRVNFGPEMADRKGLIAPVKLGGEVLKGWEIFNLPLDDKMLAGLKFQQPESWAGTKPNRRRHSGAARSIWKKPATRFWICTWGKGDLWVNGHCLGRFWNIGPTQTAYAPGCWLHAGENEIVILDYLGPENRKSPDSKNRFSTSCIPKKISPSRIVRR